MICPFCHSDMIVVEYQRIELDYCNNCKGVWFDAGELELLLDSLKLEATNSFLQNVFNSPEAKSTEKPRKCPICGQKMKKSHIGQEPQVLIDACGQGHGLWFDGGEVGEIIKQLVKPGEAGAEQKVISFLVETFKARD